MNRSLLFRRLFQNSVLSYDTEFLQKTFNLFQYHEYQNTLLALKVKFCNILACLDIM